MTSQASAWSGLVIVACCAVGLQGCGKPPSGVDLQGTYVASYPQAQERLILNPEGRFRQIVVLASPAKTNEVTGTWHYDSGDGHIVFDEHYMLVLDGFRQVRPDHQKPSDGIVILPVRRWLGRTSIGVSEGVVYRKLKK